jgi:hypothetical protein
MSSVAKQSSLALTAEVETLHKKVDRLARLIVDHPDEDRSIAGFCRRQGISRGTFYNQQKLGKAPRVAHVGSRRIITPESEREWELAREAEGAAAKAAAAPSR